jgi:hypothetical protein
MSNFKGLQIREVHQAAVEDYANLLFQSFIGFKPSVEYLTWLYFENPRGDVKGFDAFDGDKLVGHYACIPIKIAGYKKDSLLSLNTATHPDYQGRGLFSVLASSTYEKVSSSYANVIGVANAKSIGGFVKYLGFENLGNLELRLGKLRRTTSGSRIYSRDELEWRASCPGRTLRLSELTSSACLVSTRVKKYLPELKAIVPLVPTQISQSVSQKIGMTLDWRRGINPIAKLPEFLKPSPLALIFKPLLESDSSILSSFSYPDFDAF